LADKFFAVSALFLQMAIQSSDSRREAQLVLELNPKPLQVIRLTKSAAIASGH